MLQAHLAPATSENERKMCSGAAALAKTKLATEESLLNNIGNTILDVVKKKLAYSYGTASSVAMNMVSNAWGKNPSTLSQNVLSAQVLLWASVKIQSNKYLNEPEAYIKGELKGDEITRIIGTALTVAGSIVQGAGIALDIYALINGIGGAGSSPGMQVEIAGGGTIAGTGAQTGTIIGAGSLIGAMLGEGLSSLGEELKDVADESEEAHREELSEVEENSLDSLNNLDDLLTNPEKLSGISGDEMYDYLIKNGYDVQSLSKGSYKGIPFEKGGKK